MYASASKSTRIRTTIAVIVTTDRYGQFLRFGLGKNRVRAPVIGNRVSLGVMYSN